MLLPSFPFHAHHALEHNLIPNQQHQRSQARLRFSLTDRKPLKKPQPAGPAHSSPSCCSEPAPLCNPQDSRGAAKRPDCPSGAASQKPAATRCSCQSPGNANKSVAARGAACSVRLHPSHVSHLSPCAPRVPTRLPLALLRVSGGWSQPRHRDAEKGELVENTDAKKTPPAQAPAGQHQGQSVQKQLSGLISAGGRLPQTIVDLLPPQAET